MKRRHFIYTTALAGGGLMLSFQASISRAGSTMPLPAAEGVEELGDFIKIMPNGDIMFQVIKHEMGQGVSTSMAQILVEELCADWEKVKVDFPLINMARYENQKNGGYGTGGSCTLTYAWDLMRTAGATARQMLIEAAAAQWNIASTDCYAHNHYVIDKRSKKKLYFGELASLAAKRSIPQQVKLKDTGDFTVIGKGKSAKLVPLMVTGKLKYGLDTQVPGMLYAVIARCPVFKGKLRKFDASKALGVKGVKKVFSTAPIGGLQLHAYLPYDIRAGVAVVADSFWAAQKGREALIIDWDEGQNAQSASEDFEKLAQQRAMRRTDPTGYIGDENAISDLAHVRKTLHASYVFPHQVHSCMEPLNCTAHMHADGCDIWTGSQAPNLIVDEMERVFRIPKEKIKVQLFPSGGGFGRRVYPDMALEAAYISREAGNLPVKMMWTREDDQQCNLAHLFQHMEYQAALDMNDKLYAWYEKEMVTYTWAAKYADPQLPSMLYDIPNIRLDTENMIEDELVHSSAWRGVVCHGKFLSECFIDEIAARLKVDPVAFRLSMLKEGRDVFVGGEYVLSSSRLIKVIKLVTAKAGWGKSLPLGKGMGIAAAPYGNSFCAVVAEVSVASQKLKVDKITIAVDCGKLVNPSGASNQIVGGIVWGLTALFYGGLPIRNGRAIQKNFHENKLLRMDECPSMEVHFVDSQDERPWGIGEISSPLGVPAVLNAIFAATGKRIRKVPIVLEELGGV